MIEVTTGVLVVVALVVLLSYGLANRVLTMRHERKIAEITGEHPSKYDQRDG